MNPGIPLAVIIRASARTFFWVDDGIRGMHYLLTLLLGSNAR
jgi:hypothetical protein